MHRAKKFMASKLTDTKFGRSTVMKHAGEAGDQMVQILKASATKYSNKTIAKELKKKLLKIVGKGALMYESGKFSSKDIEGLIELNQTLTSKCIDVFGSANEKIRDKDLKELKGFMDDVGSYLNKIMSPHMTKKNLVLINEWSGYYSDKSFLEALSRSPEYSVEKKMLYNSLQMMSDPSNIEARKVPCAINGCDEDCAGVSGSDYCEKHHRERLMAIVMNPTLDAFLSNSVYKKYFEDYCHEIGHTNLIKLHTLCEAYRLISNRALFNTRLEVIYSKHLRSNAPAWVDLQDDEGTASEVGDIVLDKNAKKTSLSSVLSRSKELMEVDFAAFQTSLYYDTWKIVCGPNAGLQYDSEEGLDTDSVGTST